MTEIRPVFADQMRELPGVGQVPTGVRHGVVRALRRAGKAALVLGAVMAATWSTAAVFFTDLPPGHPPRTFAAILFAGVCVTIPILVRSSRLAAGAVGVMFLVVLSWFLTRTPLQNRNWTADVAQTPTASIDGDVITIRNVRNFDYHSAATFTPRWETRTYDVSKLKTVDYVLSHRGSDAIAHVIVSFGFEDGRYLAASTETRREQGEVFSAAQGFFRQYELVYVFGDERDLIRQRTNFRGEDVYMFRLLAPPERARQVLLGYLNHANALAESPEFYNPLTSHYSRNLIYDINDDAKSTISPWHLGLVLNGYSARLAYDAGSIDRSLPYEDLRRMCRINSAANDAAPDHLFSHRIRVGLPDPTLLSPRIAALPRDPL
ncbi:MAG TPA: DUF4105 domain-containing protein [Tepidisphaeraceae bacterium]|nr:DUF4105 domain-containing protein [Tepidisphaeraceae bacterium]